MDEQNFSTNHYEYNYDQKVEGNYKTKRILYIIFACIATAALTASCCIGEVKLLLWATPVVFMMSVYFFRFMFRYFQNEFKYTIDRNTFTMELIHGKAKPKTLYTADIKTAEAIVKYTEASAEKYPEESFDLVYRAYITKQVGDLYMIVFTNEEGKRCLGYFEAGSKGLSIMKFYNKNTELCNSLRH